MRAERPSPEPRPTQPPKPPFSQAMARAAAHVAEGERLKAVRAEGRGHGEQRVGERALDLIARELQEEAPREEPVMAVSPSQAAPRPADASHAEPRPAGRADAALKLVQRIEVFLASGQARLELAVGGTLQASVLLERTAPGQVAVTIRGRRGVPPPGEIARIRAEIQARGLKLSALTVPRT